MEASLILLPSNPAFNPLASIQSMGGDWRKARKRHTSCPLIPPPPQVCREYQRGSCSRGETECKFAHPDEHITVDTTDNTVTVCMDHVKGRCSREKCKYFHPPLHLQAKIKAAQQQGNNMAAVVSLQSLFYKRRAPSPLIKISFTFLPTNFFWKIKLELFCFWKKNMIWCYMYVHALATVPIIYSSFYCSCFSIIFFKQPVIKKSLMFVLFLLFMFLQFSVFNPK